MTNASEHYVPFECSDGSGVRLVPKPGSKLERAMNRIYRDVSFRDEALPMSLQSMPGTAMNNLGLKGYKTPVTPPGRGSTGSSDRRWRARDNGEDAPVDLDPDLERLARGAPRNVIQEIYQLQAERDQQRGFTASGDDCTQDRRRWRGRDQQLPPSDYAASDIPTNNPDDRYRLGAGDDPDEGHEEPDGDETVIAEIDAPPEGFRYRLYEQGDMVAVVLEPDTGVAGDPDLTTADRTYRHRVSDGIDPVLRRMNEIHRGTWVKDAATVTQTLLRHRPGPGCRLELRQNEFGSYEVLLISPVPGSDMFDNPKGSMELDESDTEEYGAASWLPQPEPSDPQQLQQPTPNFRGDSAYRSVNVLRQMNSQARSFWARR